MGVEVRPLGVKCNIQCRYCYQNPQREAGNARASYDLDRMIAAIEAAGGGPFALFGGEPLLLPIEDLERLWSWGHARYGSNAVQTNGVLISDEHIRLFRTYKVHVGISLDGPDSLNELRWQGTEDKTREATLRTQRAVERLCGAGLPPGLIVTLHRSNAAGDRLARLTAWFREIAALGIRSVRIHLLESESPDVRSRYSLTTEENVTALLGLASLEPELRGFSFDLFGEMRRLLLGEDRGTACVWNACDPYTTRAVQGVEGHGERSNCGRTNKDGIDFVKSDREGFERSLALYATPQSAGGCSGCRFFLMCKGQCPGTAIDGDWRNRSEHCEVWKALYEHLERELVGQGRAPLSLSTHRTRVEESMVARWLRGQSAALSQCHDWAALEIDPIGA